MVASFSFCLNPIDCSEWSSQSGGGGGSNGKDLQEWRKPSSSSCLESSSVHYHHDQHTKYTSVELEVAGILLCYSRASVVLSTSEVSNDLEKHGEFFVENLSHAKTTSDESRTELNSWNAKLRWNSLKSASASDRLRCDVCSKVFAHRSSLTVHKRIHSGERPYQCYTCHRRFVDPSTLTKHMRVHSGEKPYSCSLCKLTFSQSGNMKRHLKVHSSKPSLIN